MDMKKIGGTVAAALLLLWIIGRFTSNPPSNGASTVAASPADQAPSDKWHVTESRSPMDDSRTVILKVDSDDQIQGPLGSSKPTLFVRCKEGKTQIYVATGMAASVEEDFDGGLSDDHTVKIRLDQSSAVTEQWNESNDHKALFASDSADDQTADGAGGFAKQLANASTFTFQFTPFDGNPQTARFDIRGLRDHLNKVAEACAWHID